MTKYVYFPRAIEYVDDVQRLLTLCEQAQAVDLYRCLHDYHVTTRNVGAAACAKCPDSSRMVLVGCVRRAEETKPDATAAR